MKSIVMLEAVMGSRSLEQGLFREGPELLKKNIGTR